MMQSVLRWVVAAVGLLVVGPLLAVLAGMVPAPGGGGGATPLLSSSPVLGFGVWFVVAALAGLYGVVAGALTTWRLGVACSGFALLWSVWTTPRLGEMVRSAAVGTDPSWLMGLDGVFLALIVSAFAWWGIQRARPASAERAEIEPGPIAIGTLACAVAALAVAWLLARDDRVGQTVGAAVVAGIAGGAAGRALGSRAPTAWLVLGFPIAALLGPVLGGMMTSGPIDEAAFDGTISSLMRVMPIDWAAGLLIGFPVGSAQADAMIEKQHPETRAGAPAS